MRYFSQQAAESGRLQVSSRWYPSCSWLEDTAQVLGDLLLNHLAGIYHVEGNDGLSLYEIARQLVARENKGWQVEEVSDFVFDNRMTDSRLEVPNLSARFP